MVSWENILSVISNNPQNLHSLPELTIPKPFVVDRFPIQRDTTATFPTHIAPVSASASASVPVPAKPLQCIGREIDPLVIDLADTVELYDNSSRISKKQMECAEAIRIEGLLNELYKSQSGRSRGWTKIGLESLIQARCASGGDIKELDKSKKAFAWPLIGDDKVYAAFLDFLCLAKNIKIAVWFEEEKHVILFPAADKIPTTSEGGFYNITNKGMLLKNGIKNGIELIQYCDHKQWILMPPNSVLHSLSTLSLSEIDSIAIKLGITLDGNKKERVAKLAVYKLRSRLQKVEGTLT